MNDPEYVCILTTKKNYQHPLGNKECLLPIIKSAIFPTVIKLNHKTQTHFNLSSLFKRERHT